MKKGFSVKFETREIIVTKKFLKAAETYGSEEFLILLELTKQLPDFYIREKVIHRNYKNMGIA